MHIITLTPLSTFLSPMFLTLMHVGWVVMQCSALTTSLDVCVLFVTSKLCDFHLVFTQENEFLTPCDTDPRHKSLMMIDTDNTCSVGLWVLQAPVISLSP
jgi:hypothetical protein